MSLQPTSTPLTHFKLLSFDVYGTLIDWEGGMYSNIINTPPFKNLPSDHPLSTRKNVLEAAEEREKAVQKENPGLEYKDVLAEVYERICRDFDLPGEPEDQGKYGQLFGGSVGEWPVFPDTLDALERLKKHYYLVPLTNSSPSTFGASLKSPTAFNGFEFSAYYLASQIGSYKPDDRNFHYLLDHVKQEFGVEKGEIIHVAQSLFHDHVPANKFGLANCWVNRKGAAFGIRNQEAKFNWEVATMGELADLADEAFAKEGK